MANYCYNYITFNSDDAEKINKIVKFFNSYSQFETTTEWGDSVINGDYEIDDRIENSFNKYGAKWFYGDIDVSNDGLELGVSGDSAWSPMEALVGGLCYTFGVDGRIEYSEPGCNFGGMASFDKEGVINEFVQMSYSEWMYHKDDSEWVNESLYYDLECHIDDYDTFDEFIKEYPFINNPEHIESLRYAFHELKKLLINNE